MSFPLSGAPHSRWFAVSGLQACGPAVFWAAGALARNGAGCMRPLAAANDESGLIDPDVGGLDHRCPADDLGIDGGAKLGRRIADRLHHLERELLAYLRGPD